MNRRETKGLVSNMRRLGPPVLIAACLAAGPALAQSSTTIVTGEPSVEIEKRKTTVETTEPTSGTVETRKSVTKTDELTGETKTKTKTTVEEPAASSTTTIQTR
jgi:hypothetical protein